MGDGPKPPERSTAVGYAAAVVVSVVIFCGGTGLDARFNPTHQASGSPVGAVDAPLGVVEVFLLTAVAALVPVWVGLAAFRAARVTHPAWFAVYGTATGLLLANLFRDPTTGLALPGLAGAAGGLTLRAIMGRPNAPAVVAEVPSASVTPDIRVVGTRPADLEAQAARLSAALASDDPTRVVLALEEIGTARGTEVALDGNPPLSDVLRVVHQLGLALVAVSPPVNQPEWMP